MPAIAVAAEAFEVAAQPVGHGLAEEHAVHGDQDGQAFIGPIGVRGPAGDGAAGNGVNVSAAHAVLSSPPSRCRRMPGYAVHFGCALRVVKGREELGECATPPKPPVDI